MAKSKTDYKHDKRGRRNSNRGGRSYDSNHKSEEEKLNSPIHTNDPSWYFRDPVMKEGLTRLPTFDFRGTNSELKSTLLYHSSVTGRLEDVYLKSPVVAVHRLNPSPGKSTGSSAPINMAARMLYSKLSSSNAKTSGYAPQDVATLMLQLGELISMISYATRLYGITQYYNKMNRSIPNAFLKAHGIAVDDVAEWTQSLPSFRATLNQLITVANSIAFPSNIPYFKKCSYIYQNVYIDDASEMTAYHMFVPHSTWIIDETTYDEGTILKTQDTISSSTVLSYIRRMLDAILTSTTYNYIYSDILNLATRGVLGSDLLSFGTIPVDYGIEPILSDQFNWQIMNATLYGEPNGTVFNMEGPAISWTTPKNDVYPNVNGNALIYAPSWKYTGSNWYETNNYIEPIIRVQNVGISEDDLIEDLAYTGTTTMGLQKEGTNVVATRQAESIPDHYVVRSEVFYGETTDDGTPAKAMNNRVSNNTIILAIVGEFQHFPLLYTSTATTTVDSVKFPTDHRIFGRLGSYTIGMTHAIKNLRDASFLGLFTIE